MDIDGTNKKLFLAESCRLLVATNDYLFYSTIKIIDERRVQPKGIHRITRSDPSEIITIQNKGGMSGINVQNNSFYYVDDSLASARPIMKSNLMGENSNIVIDGYCGIPDVSGDWISLVKTLVPYMYEVDKVHFGDKQDAIYMLYNQTSQEWISIEEPLY
ncbi:MAG: DUF5050 domain-containing protein [Caldisericia bacterium]|nr:DUF5050 domain-containing protein [Caldisericia bacterium]